MSLFWRDKWRCAGVSFVGGKRGSCGEVLSDPRGVHMDEKVDARIARFFPEEEREERGGKREVL